MVKASSGWGVRIRSFVLALVSLPLLSGLLAADAAARPFYVANVDLGSVSVLDSRTDSEVAEPIEVGNGPRAIAITPDGRRAYVVNGSAQTVSVIDTATNAAVVFAIPIGEGAIALAVTPDGSRVYVTNELSKTISVIDTATNLVQTIELKDVPQGIAITPDGERAYVVGGTSKVLVIDTRTNLVVDEVTDLGTSPDQIAIAPDGNRAYVVNDGFVSVIDTGTNERVGNGIDVGLTPNAIAITPDGERAYVVNRNSDDVSVIDLATDQLVGEPLKVGDAPNAIAIAPDGSCAYVTNEVSGDLSAIDTRTNQVATVDVQGVPTAVAFIPDQAPVASFEMPRARPGVPVRLDASASTDPDGTVSTYAWAFGDRRGTMGGPRPSHVYSRPGTFHPTLTVTDDEGCSSSLIFTGQTAFCNGQASATQTRAIKVAYPGVRVKCPRSARPNTCRFKLQVLAKKPKRGGKAKFQSAVAKTKVRPGKSRIVSLKPKKPFRAKLARAKSVLVLETKTVGATQAKHVRRLKIVR